MTNEIKVRYHRDIEELENLERGDWIDLRAVAIRRIDGIKGNDVILEDDTLFSYRKGQHFMIDFGVAMEMPEGFEGYLAPRSSTFKNFGLIQTNGVGIIDNTYCGDSDIWCQPVFALTDGEIHFTDRTGQFRIAEKMDVSLKTVNKLDKKARGGFGVSGRK